MTYRLIRPGLERSVLPVAESLADVAALVRELDGLALRISHGPEQDAGSPSTDYESGLDLPGLSVNPLGPEPWWTRPLEDWLARQLVQYAHLADPDNGRRAWLLRGPVVGRGPDNEPLLADAEPVAWVGSTALEEARRLYEARFDAGRDRPRR